jgi:heterotetrameric sarcosine oxidase gamma subunit
MNDIYRLTPIHHWHQRHGARFVLEAGWKRVENYGNPDQEVSLVSTTAGICDATPLTKIDFQGKDAATFLARSLPGAAIPTLGFHNRARLSGDEKAGELQVARLKTERFLVFGSPDAREDLVARLAEPAPDLECMHVTDLTSAFAAMRLVGPSSAAVLKKICPLHLGGGGLVSGQCAQTPVARVGAVVMRDDDLMGWMGYLILVSRDYGEYVWKSLLSAGEGLHIGYFGLAAERRLARE